MSCDRYPDSGDLLLAMACDPQTLAGRALNEQAIDLDALCVAIERIARRDRTRSRMASRGDLSEIRRSACRAAGPRGSAIERDARQSPGCLTAR